MDSTGPHETRGRTEWITVSGRWLQGQNTSPSPAIPGGLPDIQNQWSETRLAEKQALEKTRKQYLGRAEPLDQLPDKGG